MKFCIIWKEDKSRQNNSIKSVWNSSTQMTLSDKYDFEEYSPSFWILKQNPWSKMRYAVDNFEMKRIRHLHISHNTPCLPPSSPPHQKKKFASAFFLIFPGHYSFPRRNWKECLCKVLGANKVYYPWEDVKIGDHPLVPKVFSISNMVVTGSTKNPYCYVAQ